MGASGAIILGFFGTVFAALTLLLPMRSTGLALGVPFIAFAVILLAAFLVIRLPGEGIPRAQRAKTVIKWSTIGEGAGLLIAASMAVNFGHLDLLLPATACVVGLHFLPMAYGIPFFLFYVLGFALLAAAAAGFVIHQPFGSEIAGFAAAAALWGASLLAIRRELKFKSARR